MFFFVTIKVRFDTHTLHTHAHTHSLTVKREVAPGLKQDKEPTQCSNGWRIAGMGHNGNIPFHAKINVLRSNSAF